MKRSKALMAAGVALSVAVLATEGPVEAQTGSVPSESKAPVENAPLPAPQLDKIRDYFKRTKPTADRIEVSRLATDVGNAIPADVATEPLPGALLAAMPPGVDYRYFLLGSDLVVVNAETRIVVAIIRNAA